MRFQHFLHTVALAAILSFVAAGAPALPVRPTTDPTIVELNGKGEAVLAGMKPIADAAEIKKILVRERERQEQGAKLNRMPPSTSIHMRVSKDLPYTRLIEMVDLVKAVGFAKVSVEAIPAK